jgi:hypothetical protein
MQDCRTSIDADRIGPRNGQVAAEDLNGLAHTTDMLEFTTARQRDRMRRQLK